MDAVDHCYHSHLYNPSILNNAMTITSEQQDQMLEAAKPLIKWMSENCNPHCEAHVDSGGVRLWEGVASSISDEFIKD